VSLCFPTNGDRNNNPTPHTKLVFIHITIFLYLLIYLPLVAYRYVPCWKEVVHASQNLCASTGHTNTFAVRTTMQVPLRPALYCRFHELPRVSSEEGEKLYVAPCSISQDVPPPSTSYPSVSCAYLHQPTVHLLAPVQ
jgi:hypothetical protein